MKRLKNVFWISSVTLVLVALLASIGPRAIAQVGAALVRDVDTPALQPFRAFLNFTLVNEDNLTQVVTTVPAGKRLVIEHISWSATTPPNSRSELGAIYFSLGDITGPIAGELRVNPPHPAEDRFSAQEGSEMVRYYLEPGETLNLNVSRTNSGLMTINVVIYGHYITI